MPSLFFLLSLQRCVMGELEVCTFWLIEKAFLGFFSFPLQASVITLIELPHPLI